MIKQKILWIALFRGIGDAVLFYPTLKRCQETFPDAEISLAVLREGTAEIFRIYGFKGPLHIMPKSRIRKLLWGLNVGIRNYDIVFDASSIEQMHLSRWLTLFFSKGDRVGYHYGSHSFLYNHRLDTAPLRDKHMKDLYLGLLRDYTENRKSGLLSPPEDALPKQGPERKEKIVVIHPGARDKVKGFVKSWPVEKYIRLIQKLLEIPETRIVLIGTHEEEKVLGQFNHVLHNPRITGINGETSIPDHFRIIKNADLFIGNNSGSMHIAAAYRTPLITFAGGVSMHRWGPPVSEKNIVLGLDKRCEVCDRYECKDHGIPCLEAVSVEETYEALIKLLKPDSLQ